MYTLECGKNAFFKNVTHVCPDNCRNHNTTRSCPLIAVNRCVCKEGFVFRDSRNLVYHGNPGDCIPISECPWAESKTILVFI